MVTHWPAFFRKANLKKCFVKREQEYQHGNVFTCTKSSDFLSVLVDDFENRWKKAEHGLHVEIFYKKKSTLKSQRH